jgi:hypothetical protein
VYKVEKSKVDKQDARKLFDLSFFKISPEYLIDQNRFLPVVSKTLLQYLMTDNIVVVQELELAINLALYGVLCILGNQYIVGILSCFGSTLILNFVIC